jgi:heterotetrameric sarcosine oxidase delta subunit
VIRIPCPHCSLRNSSEFRHVGEVGGARPDPSTTTPEQWRAYLYERRNPAGWTTETWFHAMGCRRFLTVERHAFTNEIRSATPVGRAADEPAVALSSRSDAGSPDAGGQAQ